MLLVAVVGNVCAGKSTLALGLHRWLRGSELISLDALRHTLFGSVWRSSQGERLYSEVLSRVNRAASDGRDVVLEGAGLAKAFRSMVYDLMDEHNGLLIELRCSRDSWEEREGRREGKHPGVGLWEASRRLWTEPDMRIDTSDKTPAETLAIVKNHIIMEDLRGGMI